MKSLGRVVTQYNVTQCWQSVQAIKQYNKSLESDEIIKNKNSIFGKKLWNEVLGSMNWKICFLLNKQKLYKIRLHELFHTRYGLLL
jgi:hypothetical protein